MMWQSGFPRVMTIDARPCSVTPMKRCGCAAARTASIAICTVPPVPFLNPIGMDMPDASSRWTWLSVVRASVVLAVEDAHDLVAGPRHRPRAGLGERQLVEQDRRRDERPVALDAEIAGPHAAMVPTRPSENGRFAVCPEGLLQRVHDLPQR